jgi:RimJ/RimL family protein N-acetyltransferase
MPPAFGRVRLKPLLELDNSAWRRIQRHFADPEIAHLNGTPPSRMPLWLLRMLLRADSRRPDRRTYGIFDEAGEFIGLLELYDLNRTSATLGIIIGERSHWNRGYGPEAIAAVLQVAFGELQLEQVKLTTFADNLRAQAAFRKAGFTEVGRTPTPGDPARNDVLMVLTREAWFRSSSVSAGKLVLDGAGSAGSDTGD